MVSPFPGMDPYLETSAIWSDFHVTLIVAMRAELNRVLPEGYIASADRHVWIEEPEEETRLLRKPDVFVTEEERVARTDRTPSQIVTAPRTVTLPWRDPKGKPFLKIIDLENRRVISAIEMLSRANKTPGKDRDAYLAKREEYFNSQVNLVELDFLRAGTRPSLGRGNVRKGHYYILVCRTWELPKASLWTFSVRDPIPPIPVPLQPGQEVVFSIRPCMDRAYGEARYGAEINYSKPPKQPLSDSDTAWVQRLLSKKPSNSKRG